MIIIDKVYTILTTRKWLTRKNNHSSWFSRYETKINSHNSVLRAVTNYNRSRPAYHLLQHIVFNAIEKLILANSNTEGRLVYDTNWKDLEVQNLYSYTGLMILASLWDTEREKNILRVTIYLENFKQIFGVITFENKQILT